MSDTTVTLPADAWSAVLIHIQWESDPALRQATTAIRSAIAERCHTCGNTGREWQLPEGKYRPCPDCPRGEEVAR